MTRNFDKEEIALLSSRLLREGVPEEAELVYDGRNRLYVYTLPSGLRVNIKAFRKLGLLRGLIYGLFARSKARKSYENSHRLLNAGFMVPYPYSYAEKKWLGGMCLKQAYYLSAQLDGARETRYWESWADRDAFVDALGIELSKIMDAGILFRDFSPGNVMLLSKAPYRFAYVDVNRMNFGVKSQRRLNTMFSRINQIPEETARLGRAFARARGLDEKQWESIALESVRKLQRKKAILHSIRDFFNPRKK